MLLTSRVAILRTPKTIFRDVAILLTPETILLTRREAILLPPEAILRFVEISATVVFENRMRGFPAKRAAGCPFSK